MRGAAAPVELPLFASFLLAGVLTVLLGPLISELLAREIVTEAQAALLFPAQFAFSSLGSVLSTLHLRRSLQAGYIACAVGLGVLSLMSWPLLVVGTALLGLGLGLVIPATNLLVAQQHPERRAAALARLNLLWSLGAVGCPLLFVAVPRGLPLPALVGVLSLSALGAGVVILLALRSQVPVAAPSGGPSDDAAWRLTKWLALGAMLFLYVGAESAIGGWLVTLSDRVGGEKSLASLLIGSGFWASLLVGRAVTPLLLRRLSEHELFRVALALAAAGTLAVLLAGSRTGVAAGAVAAGLGLAPIFPLTVSRIATETQGGSRRAGWVFIGSGLGGASLPWLTARVGGMVEELRHGLVVPIAALALLAVLARARRT